MGPSIVRGESLRIGDTGVLAGSRRGRQHAPHGALWPLASCFYRLLGKKNLPGKRTAAVASDKCIKPKCPNASRTARRVLKKVECLIRIGEIGICWWDGKEGEELGKARLRNCYVDLLLFILCS